MNLRRLRRSVSLAAGIALPAITLAQSGFDESYEPPRLPHGAPDLQGVWSNAVLTPLERPADLADKPVLTLEEAQEYERQRLAAADRDTRVDDNEADAAKAYNNFWSEAGNNVVRTLRTSLIVDPPNGRVPELTEAAKRKLAARQAAAKEVPESYEDLNLTTRCIHFTAAGPPMTPSVYNNNYQLVQTQDYVLLINEMVHETRIIPLDGRPALHQSIRQWLGSSRGRWEGDTLVVETTNRRDEPIFRGSGENMHLTERFTRVADDVLLYEFTVDDPETFTQPWTAQIPSVKADGLLYEYACHEGNRGMAGILAGSAAPENR